MNKWIKICLFVFMLVFFIMLDDFTYMSYHEGSHAQGFAFWDIDSVVYTPLFGDTGTTTPEKDCPTEECKQMQVMTEIVGYHTYAVITTLWIMLTTVFVFYIMFVRKIKPKRKRK